MFMSPACRALPSRRDVTGRMRNTEIQPQKRLDQFLRPPTQLQHSLKSLIPISDCKCWDLSGLWVELASVSTDVRSDGNVRYMPPDKGWLWGSLREEEHVVEGQRQKESISYF